MRAYMCACVCLCVCVCVRVCVFSKPEDSVTGSEARSRSWAWRRAFSSSSLLRARAHTHTHTHTVQSSWAWRKKRRSPAPCCRCRWLLFNSPSASTITTCTRGPARRAWESSKVAIMWYYSSFVMYCMHACALSVALESRGAVQLQVPEPALGHSHECSHHSTL